MSHTATGRRTTAPAVLTALRVLSVLTVVVIVWQFVTAGSLVAGGPGAESAEGQHGVGAIVLHVVSGLTMIVAALAWRAGAALWPTIVAALVFALSFLQAYLGSYGPIGVHVPGAMVLAIGGVLVAAWSFTRGAVGAR